MVLIKNGLLEILLQRIIKSSQKNTRHSVSVAPTSESSTSTVLSILNLLQLLIRSSTEISKVLSKSPDLIPAVQSGLDGDSRCSSETIKLIDILLTILFEGRNALPKQNSRTGLGSLAGLRLDSRGADRASRHLIETIRSRDYEALIDAVESGAVDVNLMDEVGQSLLNWASAFGTQEMVSCRTPRMGLGSGDVCWSRVVVAGIFEAFHLLVPLIRLSSFFSHNQVKFLLERGGDPNKGQRSSSLHYAACFGRPGVAKA